MYRILLIVIICLSGCRVQPHICPAYESTFLMDKNTENKTFGYTNFDKTKPMEITASAHASAISIPTRDSLWDNADMLRAPSLPLAKRTAKNRYLLVSPKSKKAIFKSLQTVPMKKYYTNVDSIAAANAAVDSANVSKDSTASHEPNYVITKAIEKYNVEQDYYMWVFRDILVLPDVKKAMLDEKEKSEKVYEPKAGDTIRSVTGDTLYVMKKAGLFGRRLKRVMIIKSEEAKSDDDVIFNDEEQREMNEAIPVDSTMVEKDSVTAPTPSVTTETEPKVEENIEEKVDNNAEQPEEQPAETRKSKRRKKRGN